MEDTKKEAVIDEQVEQSQDDSGNFDLSKELISFNKGESPEGTDDNVDVVESDKQEVVEAKEVSKEAVEEWLIDNLQIHIKAYKANTINLRTPPRRMGVLKKLLHLQSGWQTMMKRGMLLTQYQIKNQILN